MKFLKSFGSIIIFFALAILMLSVYQIDERYAGVVKFLGKVERKSDGKLNLKEPGLHFKFPLLTQVLRFDTRLQTLSSQPERIPTNEQKYLYVDYFIKWRITDFEKFLLATNNNIDWVNSLLSQKASDSLKSQFGQKTIEEVVSEDRTNVMRTIKEELEIKAENMGVHIVDVRIKQIELPKEVSESVYTRMRTKREQVANRHRADGKKEAARIESDADATKVEIVAQAQKEAKIMKGKADAKAAEIYALSYSKNADFYKFYRSLIAYKNVFKSGQDVVLLTPDSEFFKYFNKDK